MNKKLKIGLIVAAVVLLVLVATPFTMQTYYNKVTADVRLCKADFDEQPIALFERLRETCGTHKYHELEETSEPVLCRKAFLESEIGIELKKQMLEELEAQTDKCNALYTQNKILQTYGGVIRWLP